MSERPSSRRRFTWATAFTVIALALIAAGIFLFERCTSLPSRTATRGLDEMERIARDARNAFVQIAQLQPRVTVNDRVYFEQSSPIAELALISQRIEVEHEFLHTWAGSTKRLRLHGTFTAKAGFDLRQEFSVQVEARRTIVRLPHAQLLSVGQDAVEVQVFENGFWNRISGADVQSELTALENLAHQRAAERNLPGEAEQLLRAQLAKRLPDSRDLDVVFYEPDAHD